MKDKTSLQGRSIKSCAFQGQHRSLWYKCLTNSWLPCPTNTFPAASTLEGVLRPALVKESQPSRQHRNIAEVLNAE